MKQLFNILKFELSGHLKSKVFLGITFGFIAIIGIGLSLPRFLAAFELKPTSTEPQVLLVSDKVSVDSEVTLALFQAGMPDFTVRLSDKTIEELSAPIEKDEIDGAVVITGPATYTYLVKRLNLHDSSPLAVDEIMLKNFRLNGMSAFGISVENANGLLSTSMNSEVMEISKGQMDTFFYTYILIFALYIAILLYGQKVAISVATEKSSRAMEMLITSAKPTSLMFGKVLAAGLAGLVQMTTILLGGTLFWTLNHDLWSGNDIMNSIFAMPPYLLFYMVFFFVLGFFIYAFLYGAVGSVASYVPFTSPMAMFVRISMSDVALLEIIISVSILIFSTVGIGYLAAKIYRVGVLLYGTPPKLSSIIKAIKNK